MGNSGSGGHCAPVEELPSEGWYPKGAKVLPDRVPPLRLRLTNNGAILHNGGTISVRRQEYRQRSESEGHERDVNRDFYGSEPDLRFTGKDFSHSNNDSPAKLRISRNKKKYRAPSAPHNGMADSSSPDSYQEWENSILENQPRRLRLFKTRAETKKRISEENYGRLPSPAPLQRSLSTPQFQAELLEAAERLRPVKKSSFKKSPEEKKKIQKPPTNNCQAILTNQIMLMNRNNANNSRSAMETLNHKMTAREREHHSKLEELSWNINTTPSKTPAPVKTFYFGMNEQEEAQSEPSAVEKFVARIQNVSHLSYSQTTSPTSGSECCSDLIDEEGGGISVQLRATLPRKQLDIPRFSPTAAWRLLSALESPSPSEEDDLVPLEERVLAPPLPLHIPVHMDKSADSGISGDASPQHHDSTYNSQAAWTPQQDLEETSSDGGFPALPVSPESLAMAKFSPRFSLSLPRDDRMKLYSLPNKNEQHSSLHNLKKLKRSMSGALGKSNRTKDDCSPENDSHLVDSNWVLSRSVPNSLNIANISLPKWNHSSPTGSYQDDDLLASSLVKQPSFSYLASGGHIMYLPEYTKPREQSVGALAMSKSCEDLSRDTLDQSSPMSMPQISDNGKISSGKKFTFQSTVRQIERKRLAEKLSKQAEYREKERKSEMEAMKKVEEEFQKKREREKADIRQKLRLYSINQSAKTQSCSPNNNNINEVIPPSTQVLSEFRQPRRDYREYRPHRGGHHENEHLSSGESNVKKATVHPQVIYQMPKSTQVYITSRQSSSQQHGSNKQYSSNLAECNGQVTSRSSASDNYRRDFAQGALPHSLASSDSEVSQPNTRPTSRNSRPQIKSPGAEELNSLPSQKEVSDKQISLDITETKTVFVPLPSVPPKVNEDEITPIRIPAPSTDTNIDDVPLPSDESPPTLGLHVIQPFVKGKTYRPIFFNPNNNQVAQFAN